jgi:hypothetical protein
VNRAAAALVLGMTTSISVAGEPKVLSDLELETITAAGVLVDVNSIAAAFGDSTRSFTDANTSVTEGKSLDLGIGLTTGQALACCGEDASVQISSAVQGVGDIVQRGTRVLRFDDGISDDGISVEGLSAGFVVAVSFKDPLTMVQELNPMLMNVHSDLTAK